MGHDPGASWAVGDGATMGRSDNADIRVDDPFASSAHARIFSRGDFMWIEDMGSTNGTYLNGRTLRDRGAAQDGRRGAHRRQRVPLPGVAVALKITEQAALSDVGRQRSANEDSFVEAAPYFAVADGMGGAKAGEVASQIAAEAFDDAGAAENGAEAELRDIAQSANRRIYDLAQAEESRRGMGTTLTAAFVGDDGVSLGHVGDSRCYLMRDGELEQLTRDHSLVAELERTGQIAPGEAEHHPQRSIITRALGPERDVDVDTYTIRGKPEDVFLLCSDGLTSMISNDEVASILRSAGSLDEAADSLIRSANQSGGKDNITVVLFRLGGDETETAGEDTMAGDLHADDVRAASGQTTEAPAVTHAPGPTQASTARRARDPDPPRTTTSPVSSRAAPGGRQPPTPGRGRTGHALDRGGDPGRPVPGQPLGLLPGHRRRWPGDDVPRPALRAPAGRGPLHHGVRQRECPRGPSPPSGASAC